MPWMVWTIAGTRSCQAAARPRMPAFELWVCTTSGFKPPEGRAEPPVGFQVDPGPDRTDQLGHDFDLEFAPGGALEEVAFGAFGRAGDQGDFVVIAMVQLVDGQQRVFLGAARGSAA